MATVQGITGSTEAGIIARMIHPEKADLPERRGPGPAGPVQPRPEPTSTACTNWRSRIRTTL